MALTTLPEPTDPQKNSSKHKQIVKKKQKQNQKRSSYDHVLVTTTDPKKSQLSKHKDQQKQKQKQKQPSSWDQIKNLLTCKQIEDSRVHDPSKNIQNGYSKLGSSCSSICSFKDVVHGNTRVVHRADNSPEGSTVSQDTRSLSRKTLNNGSSSTRSTQGSQAGRSQGSNAYGSRGMQFRKLSGCYECRMIVDPSRQPMPRTTICSCPQCGEVFPKLESLELHQKIRHAVSELGPEDSGRHIVEIIFKSGWFKNDDTICKIERILKVHNTQRTIQRFEDCRDAVKLRALNSTRKDPRCAADGNELLRFYCTSLTCNLGARGASSLCGSIHSCGVCATIRHGFHNKEGKGVCTTATSGKANESCCANTGRRAMQVCRVIAGRVKRMEGETPLIEEVGGSNGVNGSYDSLGISSNLEELFVFNPRAILPCFVVIYKTL